MTMRSALKRQPRVRMVRLMRILVAMIAAWQHGISENISDLLRQYLPKGTDLSMLSQDQLNQIAWQLNIKPRKSLGWKAPASFPRSTHQAVEVP